MIGKTLGPYEITAQLGKGGMGEVYRARDPRLRREVAVKVIRADLAGSQDSRRRFEREARSVAKLNHPNICTLFDVGSEGEIAYLVMELLEGETLAARLKRSRPPRDQILRWAAEIAAALSEAHTHGIVHRDLKPSNVMLTASGVKLLDFGLSHAMGSSEASLAETLTASLSALDEGKLVGTVPYMAPEQLEGKAADVRSDVFSFGAVLYEMLTGKRAFDGSNLAAVASAILTQDPPSVSTAELGLPPILASLVRRCLAKDPSARWESVRDLEILFQELSQLPPSAADSHQLRTARRSPWLPWLIAIAAAAALTVSIVLPRGSSTRRSPELPIRFTIAPPSGVEFRYNFEGDSFAVSPDGRTIALLCNEVGQSQSFIVLREVQSLGIRRLAGTEGANSVIWSPDGQSIAFFTGDSLKRIALSGGAPVAICELRAGGVKSGSWGQTGSILFSAVQGNAIYRVEASGGTPKVVVEADSSTEDWRVSWPLYLPDGRSFLYVSGLGVGGGTLKLVTPGSPPRTLMACTSKVQFSEPDLLVFADAGSLLGQRFDWKSGHVLGGAFSVADSVAFFLSTGSAQFGTSAAGTLAYQSTSDEWRLVWFDRTGRELATLGTPGPYLDIRFSEDGKVLWFSRARPGIGTFDVWSLDIVRGVESRLTGAVASEFSPLPVPALGSVVYSAAIRGVPQLVARMLDTDEETLILPSAGFQVARGVTPDGGTLLYVERSEERNFSPMVLDLATRQAPTLLLPAGVSANHACLSPDGRFAAVISNETGNPELYVMPFPGPGARQRVSAARAQKVRWALDGSEIFYISPREGLLAVPVIASATLSLGETVQLIPAEITADWLGFDVTPDGRRILAIIPYIDANRLPLTVVLNWPAGV